MTSRLGSRTLVATIVAALAMAWLSVGPAVAEDPGRTLSGTIHLPGDVSHNAIGGIQVILTGSSGDPLYTYPENDGTYSFTGLPADTYTVRFDAGVYYEPPVGYNTPTPVSCGSYNAQTAWGTPTPIDLTTSDAAGIDFTCTKLLSISGTVSLGANTVASWLGGVTAYAYGPHDAHWATVNPTDGTYTIKGLTAGDYAVRFTSKPFNDGTSDVYPNLLAEYYDNGVEFADATPVPVTTTDVADINITLERGYSISGHITVPEDAPSSWRQGVSVSAMSSTDLANGYISPSGDYGIYGLRPGSYTVEFATQDYWDDNIGVWVQLGIPTEYFDDAAYAEDATPVVVGTANVDNINAELVSGNRFDPPPIPLIVGDPVVGTTLGVSPGSWNPGPSLLEYQWLRNGEAIDGATDSWYVIQTADRSTNITVRLTGSLEGYPSVSVTSAPLAVPPHPFDTAPVPTISGTLTAGSTLTAKPGTWSPSAALAYRWYRNGTSISGATLSTYKLTTTDRGTNITVKVTGSRADYVTTSKTSAAKYVPKVFTKTVTPTITGTAKSGKTLTAVRGTWSPTPSYSYQWYRSGVKITGATKSTYKLTTSDKGKKITVKVTGKKTGYLTVIRTSASKTVAR